MKRIRSLSASRWVPLTTLLSVVLVPVGIVLVGDMRTSGSERSAARLAGSLLAGAPGDSAGRDLAPQRVEGARACVECHKSEYVSWMETAHYANDQRLREQAAADYAEKLNIDQEDLTTNSVCAECHGTVRQQGGTRELISGASCESCHGASGGQNGWLNRHAVYGPQGTTREQETEQHRQKRIAFCEQAGMVRAANIYAIAKNCYSCHIVGDEDLVATGGHKIGSSGFDLVGWSSGEVRHNFHLDQSTNAEAPTLWMERQNATPEQRDRLKFVAGVLAGLEVAFRNRADAKNPAYIGQLGGIVGQMNGKLAQVAGATQAPELAPLQGPVAASLGRIFTPMPNDKQFYNGLADKIADAAEKFFENHDGSQLQALDGMIQGIQPQGEVYQP